MKLYHTIAVQPRWTDFDMFGHVNNSVYFQYFDLAKTDYLQKCLKGMPDIHGTVPVAVNINCDFLAPILPGNEVQVKSGITKIGDKSLVFEQQILNPATGEINCSARTVMVAFDLRSGLSVTVPELWRQLISEFQAPNT